MKVRRPVLHVVQRLLFAAGFIALAYSGGTFAYAELYQRYQSLRFERRPPVVEVLRDGDLLGRLEIPRIGMSVMVLEGVERGTLRVAAGHVPGTPLPGAHGNVAIAAHRDTFFRKLEEILVDDRIEVSTLGGTYRYVVYSTEIVEPEDTRVLRSKTDGELTLITCYPFQFIGSAPKRFIVHARLAKYASTD